MSCMIPMTLERSCTVSLQGRMSRTSESKNTIGFLTWTRSVSLGEHPALEAYAVISIDSMRYFALLSVFLALGCTGGVPHEASEDERSGIWTLIDEANHYIDHIRPPHVPLNAFTHYRPDDDLPLIGHAESLYRHFSQCRHEECYVVAGADDDEYMLRVVASACSDFSHYPDPHSHINFYLYISERLLTDAQTVLQSCTMTRNHIVMRETGRNP
jgi:hypothetical protein